MSYLFPSSGAENPLCVGPVIVAAENYAGTNAFFLTSRLTSTSWKMMENVREKISEHERHPRVNPAWILGDPVSKQRVCEAWLQTAAVNNRETT